MTSLTGTRTTEVSSSGSRDLEKGIDERSGNQIFEAESQSSKQYSRHPRYVACLIITVGLIVSVAFILLGIRSERGEEKLRFERQASELVKAVEDTWHDYRIAALWVQEACKPSPGATTSIGEDGFNFCSRDEFHHLYAYLGASDLEFKAVAYAPNITHAHRSKLEAESSSNHRTGQPKIDYQGITSMEVGQRGVTIEPRSERPFYFPQHLVEPEEGNEGLLDFDLYSTPFWNLIDRAVSSFVPVVTQPVPVFGLDATSYVMLFHPGLQLSKDHYQHSLGLGSVYVSFEHLIKRATSGSAEPSSVYIFDTGDEGAYFYGGMSCPKGCRSGYKFSTKADLDFIRDTSSNRFEEVISIEQRQWTVLVVDETGAYEADITFVILGGSTFFIACICLALWAKSDAEGADDS